MAPIIKANAFGHGLELTATALADEADLLAVAEPSDALAIAGIAPGRVLCLGPADGAQLAELLKAGIRVTVTSREALPTLGPGATVHLLVDTGLHRLGVAPQHAVELAEAIRATGANLEGLFIHVAGADRNDWSEVEAEVQTLRDLPIRGVLRHTGGTSLIVVRPDLVGDLGRPGVAVFGYVPYPEQESLIELRQVLTLVAPVLELRTAAAGDRVGYAGTRLERDTVIATLSIGAGHGINPRWADNGGWVSIRKHRCPLIGAPMLDYTLVDATGIPEIAVGDTAVLLGEPAGDFAGPSVQQTADRLGLSAEHLLVALQASIPRVLVP